MWFGDLLGFAGECPSESLKEKGRRAAALIKRSKRHRFKRSPTRKAQKGTFLS
jgi:hypothetical protein